ncbi:MAG: ABC transporter ATP-binding protein [Mycobacteriales bacterium]
MNAGERPIPAESVAPGVVDEASRAIAGVTASDGSAVLSYVGADGFPQLLVPTSVYPGGRRQVSVALAGSENPPEEVFATQARVGLLRRDPRSGVTYRITGRVTLGSGSQGRPVRQGGAGPTLLIAVERAEVTGHPSLRERTPQAAAEARGGLLQMAGLSIYYGATRAVHDLSLTVARGEIFGLLGPNGAGKTSTLSAIEGLLRPRSGSVWLDGTDVLRHPIAARAKMGVQLQATSFQAKLTVKQILRLYAGLYGVRMGEAELSSTLAGIGLMAEAGKEYKQLSGGQQQRLALQVAVVHNPLLLLLDEPTAGLDPQARRQLWERIEGLRCAGGSILLTTHSMEEAQAVCDRVAIMDHGQILTSGSPAELVSRHRDDPVVRALAHGEVTLDDVFVGLTGSEIRD